MSFEDHPGYFGITSKGVIGTHADWPIYPEEHGCEIALLWLAAFPPGTDFKCVSDIDRGVLLLADVKCSRRNDPLDPHNFHVAVWHEDLLELGQHGLITGVSAVTERRWEELKREELYTSAREAPRRGIEAKMADLAALKSHLEKALRIVQAAVPDLTAQALADLLGAVGRRSAELRDELRRLPVEAEDKPPRLGIKRRDGTFQELSLTPLETFDAEELAWPEFRDGAVRVTEAGWARSAELLNLPDSNPEILGARVAELVRLRFFDAAVREACLLLEHRTRVWLGSERWGDALVDELIVHLRERDEFIEAFLRVLRGQVRIVFKFIRNDFMHNFVDIDEIECRALLFQVGRAMTSLDDYLET